MRKPSQFRPARGFSLIEVLIAVVILSVGLLALASLQVNLIRSSSDTKAQSTAMALAKQKLEQLLAFKEVGGADSTCTTPALGGTNTCYRKIDSVATEPVSAGGVDFNRKVTVSRYIYDKTLVGGVPKGFVLQLGSNTALDSTLLTSPVTYLAGKEFKKILVEVTWTDASGNAANNVAVEDAINAIEPSDSAAVAKSSKGAEPRKAKSIITNPASVAGVIPIAIGNGTDTAATNPRPVIVGQGNNTTVTETRFDVYTYAALSGTSALAQSRVETAVIGCHCSVDSSTTHAAARPTYWDGAIYTTPDTASGIPVSVPNNSDGIDRSDLCTSCCEDHHDPVGVTGAKFDPRRSTHSHYLKTNLTAAVTDGQYDEACRLIRVDGIFRVAQDTYADDFSQLATAGLTSSSPTATIADAVPGTGSGSMSEAYQNFVLSYLTDRFVSSGNYNTLVTPSTVTGYSTLQLPGTVAVNTSNVSKYMHVRGLYIDHLEPSVISIIDDARTNCGTQPPIADCVLKFLPFTSINMTELAVWTSLHDDKIHVSNSGFNASIDITLPVRSEVTLKNAANTGDTTIATSTVQRSSAGLAVTGNVFPSDQLTAYQAINGGTNDYDAVDTQDFVVGAGVVADPNAGHFSVTLSGTDLLTKILSTTTGEGADVRFTLGLETTCDPTTTGTVQPFTCYPNTGQTLGGSVPVKVGNYNREATVTVGNACRSGNHTTPMTYRKIVTVTSATVDGVAATTTTTNNGAPGSITNGGEYTVVTANPLNNDSVVALGFSSISYTCPSNWATYINNDGTKTSLTNAQQDDTTICTGSGSQVAPLWSTTTYTSSCPNNISPFNGQ